MAGVLGGGETLRKLGCHGKVFVVTNNRHVVQIEDLEHPQMKWGLRCPMALPTLVWNNGIKRFWYIWLAFCCVVILHDLALARHTLSLSIELPAPSSLLSTENTSHGS